MKYLYQPGIWDQSDPRVIRGEAIVPGSIVTVTKSKPDPIGLFRWIMDKNGNEQSVFKHALVPMKGVI